jgi:hypothetical protein
MDRHGAPESTINVWQLTVHSFQLRSAPVSEKKGWGKTVMGWFVVEDQGTHPSEKAVPADKADALIAKYTSGGSAPASLTPPIALKGPLPPMQGDSVDFAQVYDAAGIGADERDRLQKAQDLLRSLPAETPVQVKRQIVEASLRAFGVPTERIIESAVSAIGALESFIQAGQAETQKLLTEAQQRISSLEAEITSVKKIMEQAVSEQEARARATNTHKLTIQDVLEFFGQEAVEKVVEASPKLQKDSR